MQLKTVYSKTRQVVAVMHGSECPALDALNAMPPNLAKTAKGFDALFRRYAELGRAGLTTELFHEVDKDHGIWEFIKGSLRILCFVAPDNGALLILTHSMIKKQQKTPPSEVNKAIRVLSDYKNARKSGGIEFVSHGGIQND